MTQSKEIVGFFLEEAKEHLDTIEKALLDLHSTMNDPERLNEVYRAAHSVKGGAAMLGFGSIQKTAHRLEDCFKILKDNPVEVDQKLENLFLKGFDALRELLERLQGPFGLQEEDADKIVKKTKPVFVELLDYINNLTGGAGDEIATSIPPEERDTEGQLPPDFAETAIDLLKQMLQQFKQKDSKETRSQLDHLCQELTGLAEDRQGWKDLTETARKAIGNTNNPYRVLAPFVIKDLKQASDRLATGKDEGKISPSSSLQKLTKTEAGAWSKQIVVSLEPKAAANTLTKSFNKQQLAQLVKLLQKAAK